MLFNEELKISRNFQVSFAKDVIKVKYKNISDLKNSIILKKLKIHLKSKINSSG